MTEIIEKKEMNTDIILTDKFLSLINVCNDEHLQFCQCQDKLIKEYYEKYMNEELKDLKKKGLDNNCSVLDVRKKHALKKAQIAVGNYCEEHNIRCPIEQEEVKQTISLFNSKFDLNDPRVYMIVKAVLSHQLSVYRMQLQSNYRGLLQEHQDELGNTTYILNPVEEAKRKLDDSIIIAIEKLNKIMLGEMHVNLNANVNVDWEDALRKLKTKEDNGKKN